MAKINFQVKAFSEMIKAKRKWAEFDIRAAAKEIGISASTLSRLENKKLPDLITCKKVCNWLNLDIDYFFS